MEIEIINTGSELLLGRVLNTHQQFLCRALADIGWTVRRQVCVADNAEAIRDAVKDALGRADLILTTGGLGPTSDDRTRDAIAELFGRRLKLDPDVLRQIAGFFSARNRLMPEGTKVQALVPEGALVLANAHGTAPGLVIEAVGYGRDLSRPPLLVMLPGPPRELCPMFMAQIVPLLRERFPGEQVFVCRTLKTTGIGESPLEDLIAAPLQPLMARGLEVGYCARTGEVDVRFVARQAGAEELVLEAEQIVRRLIREYVFGLDDDQLESVIVRLLTERRQTVAVAESCTGGFIANRVTNVPGASNVFWGGLVTYANAAKERLLGVRARTLVDYGAVSEETAREMALGLRQLYGTDFALAVTGVAGPGGGTPDKPVGTVFIALAGPGHLEAQRQRNPYDRQTFKYVTSQQALEMLRRALITSAPIGLA